MMIYRPALLKLTLSAALLSAPLNVAFAQEASDVAERFRTLLGEQGADLQWTGLSGDAEEMILDGVTIDIPGEADRVQVGKVTLKGVSEDGGDYRIDALTTEPFHITEDQAIADVSAIKISGLVLPSEKPDDPLGSLMMYDTAELPSLQVNLAGKPVFSLSNMTIEVTPPVEDKPLEFTGAAEKFSADLTAVSDEKAKAMIEALGYQSINGTFGMAGSWQPSDGRLALSRYDIAVEDAGTLGVNFDFGGYTLAFLKSLQDLQKKMAEQTENSDNSAQGLAMLGLMQQLTFHGANIRFDDASLTGKVLEFYALRQDLKPQDVANQIKAILPFFTAQLNNPELSGQISSAVGAFLDDPKSLQITAAPASPVPFAMIAAGTMTAPVELPKILGVTVSANEDRK